MIIDISGVHMVKYSFCGCMLQKLDVIVQLMRVQWFPATGHRPHTVVTFHTLRLFHALAIQGKVNAYDFYNGLVCITDGTGLYKPKVSSAVLTTNEFPNQPLGGL